MPGEQRFEDIMLFGPPKAKVFSRVFFYHLIANAKRTVLEKLLIRNRILEKKVRNRALYFMRA